jgi:hypothetical protein
MLKLAENEKYNRFQKGGRVKSQRLINAMLEAIRNNPSMTENELYYVAFGFKAFNRG